MKRSIGVTIIAILSLLGSAIMLLLGIIMMFVPLLVPTSNASQIPGSPMAFKSMMLMAGLVYILPAVWGIATGIGLFLLKEWSRISIIVFAVLLILTGACTGLVSLVFFIPSATNQTADPVVMAGVRWFTGGLSFVLVSIGAWWLAFFSRPRVKQQFARVPIALGATSSPQDLQQMGTADPLPANVRPLSITVIAWLMIVGCLCIPMNLFLHTPAILLTRIVTGWMATLYFLTSVALGLYIAIGLLRLKASARTAAVAYYGFFLVNSTVFYFAPGGHSRMTDLMQRSRSLFPWATPGQQQTSMLFDTTQLLVVSAGIGLISLVVPLYFLVSRKRAFERAAAGVVA